MGLFLLSATTCPRGGGGLLAPEHRLGSMKERASLAIGRPIAERSRCLSEAVANNELDWAAMTAQSAENILSPRVTNELNPESWTVQRG